MVGHNVVRYRQLSSQKIHDGRMHRDSRRLHPHIQTTGFCGYLQRTVLMDEDIRMQNCLHREVA